MVIALIAQLAPFLSGDRHWPLPAYAIAVAVSVPVIWRRRAPFLVLLVTEIAAAGYDLAPGGPRQPLWYGALIAMFTVAAQAPRWQRITAIVIIGWGAFLLTGSIETAARGLLLWTTAYVAGRAWANRQEEVRTLQERARHLERERELEAERERSRIARDMHDILAHAVSITIAQAEAGPVLMKQGPARTRRLSTRSPRPAARRWPSCAGSSASWTPAARAPARRSRHSPRSPPWSTACPGPVRRSP